MHYIKFVSIEITKGDQNTNKIKNKWKLFINIDYKNDKKTYKWQVHNKMNKHYTEIKMNSENNK